MRLPILSNCSKHSQSALRAEVIVDLEFSTLGQPTCNGVWGAGSSASDYEVWTPTDGRQSGRNCIMGRELTSGAGLRLRGGRSDEKEIS